MREAIEQFVQALCEEERYCTDSDEWQFLDGSACAVCTCSAKLVARRFDGLVLGYHSLNNPNAAIGLPNWDGHDFTLIDGRWLADYWAWRVEKVITKPIFDLSNEVDHKEVTRLYGTPLNWSMVELNSIKPDGRGLDPTGEHACSHNLSEHDAP